VSETPLRLHMESIAGGICLSLAGELDIATADSVKAALERSRPEPPGILVIDLRDLAFMDSTGLQVMLQAARRADDDGSSLILVRGPRTVQRVFELAQLEGRLRFIDHPSEVIG
jgi:anti-sigma B factor antagonist